MPVIDKGYTIAQQFKVSEKSVEHLCGGWLANPRHDGFKGVRVAKLNEAKMTMSDELMNQIVLNSLSSLVDPFVISI